MPRLRRPSCTTALLGAVVACIAPATLFADPFIAPGRSELRVELEQLGDSGIITGPLTTWPISWQSLVTDLENASPAQMDAATRAAFDYVTNELAINAQTHRVQPHVRVGSASEPIAVRSFADTPRDEGEIEAGIGYTGDRLTFNVNLTRAVDGLEDWRLDGSYVGFATSKWAFVAGYPERWWGPGMQSSLILSTNARPLPQLSVERISVDGFEQRWLRWLGPWSVSTFLAQLDDTRVVNDALVFGLRLTIKPLPQFEFAFSRAAQLCGDGRDCGFDDFGNMLIGRDNRERNVSAEDEPGNQLAGVDARWSFADRPIAVYGQWIGEDSRQGGPQIGSWLRLLGFEISGRAFGSSWRHRTYVEIADTTCQEGGFGFGGDRFNCGYQHGTFRSGFRYEQRSLGHTVDGDSEAMSVISVLSGRNNQSYELGAYSARVNQGPGAVQPHFLSTQPASRFGIDISHARDLPIGRLRLRLSAYEQRNQVTNQTQRDTTVAVEWLVGYW